MEFEQNRESTIKSDITDIEFSELTERLKRVECREKLAVFDGPIGNFVGLSVHEVNVGVGVIEKLVIMADDIEIDSKFFWQGECVVIIEKQHDKDSNYIVTDILKHGGEMEGWDGLFTDKHIFSMIRTDFLKSRLIAAYEKLV
jgi:hypothetical protein